MRHLFGLQLRMRLCFLIVIFYTINCSHFECDNIRIFGGLEEYSTFYADDAAGNYEFIVNLIQKHMHMQTKTINSINTHILDIGSGEGTLIELLFDEFTEISVIEPNQYFRQKWLNKTWMSSNNNILHLYPYTIEHLLQPELSELFLNRFSDAINVIVSLHTFYHFNIEYIEHILKSIYSMLKPLPDNGIAIISIVHDSDIIIDRLIKILSAKYKLSELIEEVLNRNNIKYDSFIEEQHYGGMNKHIFTEFIRWDTLQIGMNPNYFPNGINEEQIHQMNEKIEQFISNHFILNNSSKTYAKTYKIVHYVLYKNV